MIGHEPRADMTVERLLSTAYAQDRLRLALYEAVMEGLSIGPCEVPEADDRAWLREAMTVPIEEASTVALGTLARAMARALDEAPADLVERLERSRRWQGLGWE